jgi:cellulose synthase/poly-beta-1,6-N-acetylglucosamine synthase-like glycosyltransferase
MDIIVDIVNSIFIISSTYFTVLFLLLFFQHEERIFSRPKMKKFPSVSIVVPVFNEEDIIEKVIDNIKKLSYPRKKEIIVVDDGSTDGTCDILKKIRGIKVFRKENGGRASAVNYGLKKARGEIFVRIDADSFPEKDALMKAIPHFEKDVASVATTVLIRDPKGLLDKMQEIEYVMIAWSRKILEYLDAIYVTPGPMSFYRRDVLLKVGGFDEKNLTEDIEIAWKLTKNKYRIKMALDTKVYTKAPNDMRRWWDQRLRWNIGGMQTYFKYLHLMFSKKFKNVGMLLLPLFSISYVLNLVGIMFTIYIIQRGLQYLIGAYVFGFNPFVLSFTIIPDMFIFLTLFSVLMVLAFLKINFGTMDKISMIPKKLSNFLLYIFIYILIFPINLLHSTLKYFTGRYRR